MGEIMDNQGFIFTTDATLALVVFMVFSTAFASYYFLPNYLGNDHEHLEMLAADALKVMENDGTLYVASSEYQLYEDANAKGNTVEAQKHLTNATNILNGNLSYLIPADTGYKITLSDYPSVENSRGLLYSNDVATRVDVISGPKEGWMGRAWYKVEKAEFIDQPTKVTTTIWNFHNWLKSCSGPWGSYGLDDRPYWGKGSTAQNIAFSIPDNAAISGLTFLLGSSSSQSKGKSYAADVVINSNHNIIKNSSFTFLNLRPGTQQTMYNYQGFPDFGQIHTGVNGFYVNFINATSYNDMPWFALIANYTTTFKVPEGVLNDQFNFTDAAGVAVPATYDRYGHKQGQDLDGDGDNNEYGRIYDLNTGTMSSFTNERVMDWNTFSNNRNTLDNYDDGVPFVINSVKGEDGSAVSVTQEFDIPTDNVRILDGYVVLNTYGAVDNAMVEVWDGNQWRTVFCSFDFKETPSSVSTTDFSEISDGYGNIPGILYIGNYLKTGHNKVRITIWDQVPSTDYDLVGLVDCYTHISYTRLPIRWENFAYNSFQDSSSSSTSSRTFSTDDNAREVYLFVGTGSDTRHIKVEVAPPSGGSSSWKTLYDSDTVPYYINLAQLDASKGYHIFTNGGGNDYTIKKGTNYRTRVTITSSTNEWESGDTHTEIFSGTRVSVLYPEFLENMWTTSYSGDPNIAKQQAEQDLIDRLTQSGITPDPDLIRSEALYTGDLPNSIPVRLDLWKH